jgi:hypothetical protein
MAERSGNRCSGRILRGWLRVYTGIFEGIH